MNNQLMSYAHANKLTAESIMHTLSQSMCLMTSSMGRVRVQARESMIVE